MVSRLKKYHTCDGRALEPWRRLALSVEVTFRSRALLAVRFATILSIRKFSAFQSAWFLANWVSFVQGSVRL